MLSDHVHILISIPPNAAGVRYRRWSGTSKARVRCISLVPTWVGNATSPASISGSEATMSRRWVWMKTSYDSISATRKPTISGWIS
jgi:hypothetical protein